jgi:DNA-binding NtrC family response regulator
MKEGTLLIADDNRGLLNALQLLLQPHFEEIITITEPGALRNILRATDVDVVLLDMNFKAGINSGNEGIFWLREIRKNYPLIEIVLITAYGDVELAVRALKEGASDFVLKPWDNQKLIATLKTALRLRNSNKEINQLKSRESLLKHESNRTASVITGESQAMKSVMQVVQKIAATDANVLITGENGTGKEIIAREIHRLSLRNKELFVAVDLSSLTETLFESELFGHKKGSFTNAYEDKTGRFVLADKGSLFLDEIGNIPLNLQSKLLSVLQTRTVLPVGSNKEIPMDIRLISATNKDLNRLISENQFRQDLLYRMNTIQIHLPSLRDRTEDIESLVNHFAAFYGKKYGKEGLKVTDDALKKLKKYQWPGNIRELQHAIEKAIILSEQNKLIARDFFFGADVSNMDHQPETLEEMEKKMIIQALMKNDQNQSATAQQLGITRQTLYNKIKKYEL